MPKTRGLRNRSRHKLRKNPRQRGMQPLGSLIRSYEVGDRVVVSIDPSVHKGMPHPRYHGMVAIIKERRGRGYVVTLREGKKTKALTVRPEHIIPYEQ